MNPSISFEEDKVTHEPIAVLEGRFKIMDLVNVLSQMEKLTGNMPAALTTGTIDVFPIVSQDTHMPLVELQSPAFDKPLQLDHIQAFALGHTLIEVASISIGDATIFGFISDELQIPKEQASGMLYAFRAYRNRMLSNGDQDGETDSP